MTSELLTQLPNLGVGVAARNLGRAGPLVGEGHEREAVDPILVSAAFARAADAAYASVRNPAEGTMLSAVRAMAHRLARDVAHMSPPRLDPNVDPAKQDALMVQVRWRHL